MVRRRAKPVVSNHVAAPSFETPVFATLRRAPQDEGGLISREANYTFTLVLTSAGNSSSGVNSRAVMPCVCA